MKRRALGDTLLGLILALAAGAASADTAAIAGVVVRKPDGQRAGGVKVALYAGKTATGTMTGWLVEDTTSSGGVYNLVLSNVGPTVERLWVVCEPPERAIPQPVQLRGTTGGIRYGKPADLALVPSQQVLLSDQEVSDVLLAVVETQRVMLAAGTPEERVHADTELEFSRILAQRRTVTTPAAALPWISADVRARQDPALAPGSLLRVEDLIAAEVRRQPR